MAKKTREGKGKLEIIRCVKRFIAREAYRALISIRNGEVGRQGRRDYGRHHARTGENRAGCRRVRGDSTPISLAAWNTRETKAGCIMDSPPENVMLRSNRSSTHW